MNYKFPRLEHIDQIIPHVEGCPAFLVVKKGEYTVVNTNPKFDYSVIDYKTMVDAFPPIWTAGNDHQDDSAAIRRECRGLLFNKHGELVRRPYHKFFNMDEREETKEDKINWSVPHTFLEKLDGSMVTPFNNNGHIRWATRMGITSVAMQAECFVAKHRKYIDFAEYCIENNNTPIFEWCSYQNKVVIDYPEQLILTGVRKNKSGEYLTYTEMLQLSHSYMMPYVNTMSMPDHWDVFSDAEGIEGTVIRFDDGHMVKMKTSWYVGIHKALQGLLFEKDLLYHILKETLDDVIPFLPEKEREQVKNYQRQVESNIVGYTQMCYGAWRDAQNIGRKNFGLSNYPKMVKSVVFDCWNNIYDIPQSLRDKIEKHCSSQSKVDSVRSVFGTHLEPWKLRRSFE